MQLLSRFKVSLDGRPQPNNRFMKHWIPFSIQDRLVLHVILCTTASFLNETGLLPKTLLHIHRATVTKMLNEYISSPTLCTGDSAILAVTQLILTSWYWSSTEELHAHMSGFRKMIQLRGGCRDLGMEGCTSKIALLYVDTLSTLFPFFGRTQFGLSRLCFHHLCPLCACLFSLLDGFLEAGELTLLKVTMLSLPCVTTQIQ